MRAVAVVFATCAATYTARAQDSGARDSVPQGWFGVTIADSALIDENGNPFFSGYPLVTGVEHGSPAERAGVKPGDILITFNSHDMKGSETALRRWLQPGASFRVTYRRDDQTRQARGVIGRRPSGFDDRVELIWSVTAPRADTLTFDRGEVTRVTLRAPTPMPVALPPVLIPTFTFGGGVYPFAGAEFTALNPDLRETLGVDRPGVFVTSVAPESPARAAGLRGGDVIIQADSIRVEAPMALVRAIREASDRSLRLQIVRQGHERTILLKW